jgi:hypothetical protein
MLHNHLRLSRLRKAYRIKIHNAVLNTIAEWLSPMGVVGWAFFAILSVACSWLTYLLLRSKLGGVGPNHTT